MSRRTIRLCLALTLGGATGIGLSGCGNSRTPVPDLSATQLSSPLRPLALGGSGISLQVPRNWTVIPQPAPLLVTISSGTAIAAVWSYPRHLPPPQDSAALAGARRRLLAALMRRDPSLRLIRSGVIVLDGHPAVELDAFERINGQLRRVRSVHVFLNRAEVVLDAYAPPEIFHSVDHAVFSPLKHSLHLAASPA